MKFVFRDTSGVRWKKIKRFLRGTLLTIDLLCILSLIAIYMVPRLGEKYAIDVNLVADEIAMQRKEEILVTGSGVFVDLLENQNKHTLLRERGLGDKQVILTFDDGPDPAYTPAVLDILKNENVKAVFFVIGEQAFKYPEIIQRMVEEGHVIGMHTFSHIPDMSEEERTRKAGLELDFPQKILIATSGYKSRIFRAPFWGAEDTISEDNLRLVLQALDRDFEVMSSTVDSFDWQQIDRNQIADNAVNLERSQVILLHDGGGDRRSTLQSLPEIIKRYRSGGFEFVKVENGFVKATFTDMILAKIAVGWYWIKVNFWLVMRVFFQIALGILATDICINLVLALWQAGEKKKWNEFSGRVTAIVPALNEEKTIGKTIRSLMRSNYANLEIIVVDNGSSDATYRVAKKVSRSKRLKVLTEKRRGKYNALNTGVAQATGEIIVAIDADTQILPTTISNLLKPFGDPKIGAVAGNLKVGNIVNLLTAFQALEYIVGLNLERRAFEILGAILVVPGALGAWRKQVLVKTGGYKGDTLTEDADLSVRVQKIGYKIIFAEGAVAYTEAPENLRLFMKQRLRWTFGIIQVLYKHRKMYFRPKYGVLGMFVLPFVAGVRLPIRLLAPVFDMVALVYMIFNPTVVGFYFGVFMALTVLLAAVAFALGRERKVWLLATLPFSRIMYQAVGYWVLYKSVLLVLKGIHLPWVKLTHIGSVSLTSSQEMVPLGARVRS